MGGLGEWERWVYWFNPEDERVDRKGRKKVDERVKVSGGRIVELA